MPKIFLIHIFYIFWIFFAFNPSTCPLPVVCHCHTWQTKKKKTLPFPSTQWPLFAFLLFRLPPCVLPVFYPSFLSFGFAFWTSTFSPKKTKSTSRIALFSKPTYRRLVFPSVAGLSCIDFFFKFSRWVTFLSCSFSVFLFFPLLLHCIWVFVDDFSLVGCSPIQEWFFLVCFCCLDLYLLLARWAFCFVFCFLFILGALHAIIFFLLWFLYILLWTEKRCDLCLILMLWTTVCLASSVVWPLCSFLCLKFSTLYLVPFHSLYSSGFFFSGYSLPFLFGFCWRLLLFCSPHQV